MIREEKLVHRGGGMMVSVVPYPGQALRITNGTYFPAEGPAGLDDFALPREMQGTLDMTECVDRTDEDEN